MASNSCYGLPGFSKKNDSLIVFRDETGELPISDSEVFQKIKLDGTISCIIVLYMQKPLLHKISDLKASSVLYCRVRVRICRPKLESHQGWRRNHLANVFWSLGLDPAQRWPKGGTKLNLLLGVHEQHNVHQGIFPALPKMDQMLHLPPFHCLIWDHRINPGHQDTGSLFFRHTCLWSIQCRWQDRLFNVVTYRCFSSKMPYIWICLLFSNSYNY